MRADYSYVERGKIPAGYGPVKHVRTKNPYSQTSASVCPICGDTRGPTKNHKKCSRILQKQRAESEKQE